MFTPIWHEKMPALFFRFQPAWLVLVVMLMLFFVISPAQAVAAGSGKDYVPGQVLVKYKAVTTAAVRSRALRAVGAQPMQHFNQFDVQQVRLPAGVSVEATVRQLEADPSVEFAEPNYRRYFRLIPNDPAFTQQWGLQNTGQLINDVTPVSGIANADMAMVNAWNSTTGNKNVIVAIIDDSVDIGHPDLYANIWLNPGEIAGNGLDDDGNGFIDDLNGWDFKNNDNDPSADVGASEGHGTAVAGVIGAISNNGIGVTGVNWQLSMMPIKFAGDVATELSAIQYAIRMGANIINASYGGPFYSQTEAGAVQQLQTAGILMVTAAGNYDLDNDIVPDYPSSLPYPNVLSVAATTPVDTIAPWSQFGGMTVDVTAPGISVYTTMSPYGSATFGNRHLANQYYDYIDGSSFSAPYVTGIAALIKANAAAATFEEIKGRILAGAAPLAALQGLVASAGRADANGALTVAPQPVLLMRDYTWLDQGNGLPDAGEIADLHIRLENVWQTATAVSATLTALSANISVLTATVNYPNLPTDAYAASITPFRVQVAANATGYQLYKWKLDITAAGGYLATRYYQVGVGALQNGITHNGTLLGNDQDDYQFYHLDVPAGASNLSFRTTSGQNIDLLVNPNNPPKFLPNGYFNAGGIDATTLTAFTSSGNEVITVAAPQVGTWYAAVLKDRYSAVNNYPFSLTATYTVPVAPTPVVAAGGGSGGCSLLATPSKQFDPTFVLLVLLALFQVMKRKRFRQAGCAVNIFYQPESATAKRPVEKSS